MGQRRKPGEAQPLNTLPRGQVDRLDDLILLRFTQPGVKNN
jgi:hypothetical protein